MKFDCGETWEEKHTRLDKWHRFFCLLPRQLSPHDCRWLEYIERRGALWYGWGDCGWNWEYRAIRV